MVTAEKVWAALAEVPDPEIPVISLVDLGVVREVEVDGDHVRVEFTPTFLGCPAQEVMRDAAGRGRPRGRRRAGDRRRPRRLLVDRPHHPGGPPQAPRSPASRPPHRARRDRPDARPARRAGVPLPLLRLRGHPPGEPVRPDPVPLDPLLRSCRQPFEQFKTIWSGQLQGASVPDVVVRELPQVAAVGGHGVDLVVLLVDRSLDVAERGEGELRAVRSDQVGPWSSPDRW